MKVIFLLPLLHRDENLLDLGKEAGARFAVWLFSGETIRRGLRQHGPLFSAVDPGPHFWRSAGGSAPTTTRQDGGRCTESISQAYHIRVSHLPLLKGPVLCKDHFIKV